MSERAPVALTFRPIRAEEPSVTIECGEDRIVIGATLLREARYAIKRGALGSTYGAELSLLAGALARIEGSLFGDAPKPMRADLVEWCSHGGAPMAFGRCPLCDRDIVADAGERRGVVLGRLGDVPRG